MTLKHICENSDFTQELLARLSPVTELGHLRPPTCDTISRDVQRTRTASVEPVVATHLPERLISFQGKIQEDDFAKMAKMTYLQFLGHSYLPNGPISKI